MDASVALSPWGLESIWQRSFAARQKQGRWASRLGVNTRPLGNRVAYQRDNWDVTLVPAQQPFSKCRFPESNLIRHPRYVWPRRVCCEGLTACMSLIEAGAHHVCALYVPWVGSDIGLKSEWVE
eukprot:361855-Chlamydomonas_euryale.AAC.7